jgi:hypothetical protein
LSPYSLDGVSKETTANTDSLVQKLTERLGTFETELCELATKHQATVKKLKERIAACEEAKKPGNWVFLGREHQDLTVPENSLLRYGLNAAWVEKKYSGKFKATNEFFGRDPLFGTGKVVEMWVQ